MIVHAPAIQNIFLSMQILHQRYQYLMIALCFPSNPAASSFPYGLLECRYSRCLCPQALENNTQLLT